MNGSELLVRWGLIKDLRTIQDAVALSSTAAYLWAATLRDRASTSSLLPSAVVDLEQNVYWTLVWVRHGTENENVAPGPSFRTAQRRP